MRFFALMVIFYLFSPDSRASKLSDDSFNTLTKYKGSLPSGVCFENSYDKYRIKKGHTISDLMIYFNLKPLWCESCSVDSTQYFNNIKNIDYIEAGETLMIPKKCNSVTNVDSNTPKISLTSEVVQNFDTPKTSVAESLETAKPGILNQVEKTKAETLNRIEKNSELETLPVTTSTTQLKPKKKILKTSNKISIEPLLLYSELNGTSLVAISKIRGTGTGSFLSYNRNLNSFNDVFLNTSVIKLNVVEDTSQLFLDTPTSPYMSIDLGHRYYLNSDWSLSSLISYRENLFYETISTSTVKSLKAANYLFKISPDYKIWSHERLFVIANMGYTGLLPTSVGNEKTKIGSEYNLGIKILHKLNWGKITAAFDYSNRQQKTNLNNFNEQVVTYSAGLQYLF